MNQQEFLQNISSLPPPAQQEVLDFIAFLKQRHAHHQLPNQDLSSIQQEPFIGMWKNRTDIGQSSAWVRNVRQHEWG